MFNASTITPDQDQLNGWYNFGFNTTEEDRYCTWSDITTPTCPLSFEYDYGILNQCSNKDKVSEEHLTKQFYETIMKITQNNDKVPLKTLNNKKETSQVEENEDELDNLSVVCCISQKDSYQSQIEKTDDLTRKVVDIFSPIQVKMTVICESIESLKKYIDKNNLQKLDKHGRYGRIEDRELFSKLQKLCYDNGREASEFLCNYSESDFTLQKILSDAYKQTNFKRDKIQLLKRIRKLISNQKFSLRELKILKKLVRAQKLSHKIDYKQIEYFFPGKLSENVRKEIEKLVV